MTSEAENSNKRLSGLLVKLRDGDLQARDALIAHSCRRLERLASQMLSAYPRLRRWEQTDDVLQNAMLRLHKCLREVRPESPSHFFRLAAVQIRRELIDLARHHFGPLGHGASHETEYESASSSDPRPIERYVASEQEGPTTVQEWSEFHECVQRLPEDEREVFQLLWYEGLSQEETADVLDISLRTVSRRWKSARIQLHRLMHGAGPQ